MQPCSASRSRRTCVLRPAAQQAPTPRSRLWRAASAVNTAKPGAQACMDVAQLPAAGAPALAVLERQAVQRHTQCVCCRAVSPLPVAACSCSYAAQAAMVSSHTCLGVLLSYTQHPTFPSGSGTAWLHAASQRAMMGIGGCSATVGAACSPSGLDLEVILQLILPPHAAGTEPAACGRLATGHGQSVSFCCSGGCWDWFYRTNAFPARGTVPQAHHVQCTG